MRWSGHDSLKYIEQNGITHVKRDSCQPAMTLWFRKETTEVMLDASGKEAHLRYLHT